LDHAEVQAVPNRGLAAVVLILCLAFVLPSAFAILHSELFRLYHSAFGRSAANSIAAFGNSNRLSARPRRVPLRLTQFDAQLPSAAPLQRPRHTFLSRALHHPGPPLGLPEIRQELLFESLPHYTSSPNDESQVTCRISQAAMRNSCYPSRWSGFPAVEYDISYRFGSGKS
jgi:hypothetical protein